MAICQSHPETGVWGTVPVVFPDALDVHLGEQGHRVPTVRAEGP